MGMIVGLNYLANHYGPATNQTYGGIVIALSLVAILGGIAGALITQPRGGMAAFSSVNHAGHNCVDRPRGADRWHDLPRRAALPGTRLSPAWRGCSLPYRWHCLWYFRSMQR